MRPMERPPLELHLDVLDPRQVRSAEGFIRFRVQGRPTAPPEAVQAWDLETSTRASKMLLAPHDAPLTERAMGMTAQDLDDWDPRPGDPF